MNQQILNYFQSNKNSFSSQALKNSLLRSGYKAHEIDEVISFLYRKNSLPQSLVPKKSLSKVQILAFLWKAFVVLGILLVIVGSSHLVASFFNKNKSDDNLILTYTKDEKSSSGFENQVIKKGYYEINKSVSSENYAGSYKMTITKVEAEDFYLKFYLRFEYTPKNQYSSGYISSPCLADLTDSHNNKVQVYRDSDYKCSSESLSSYSSFKNSNTIEGWVSFNQVASGEKSFNFTYYNFPEIKNIVLE